MGSPHVTLCAAAVLLATAIGPAGAALAASAAPEQAVRAESCLTRPDTPDAGFAPTPYPSRSCPPRDANGPRPPRTARQALAPGAGERGTPGHTEHGAPERAAAVPVARAAGPSTAQAVVGLLLAATAALVVALGVLSRGRR